MQKKRLILVAFVLFAIVGGFVNAPVSHAINPYGGPCDVAEDLGAVSHQWNTLCNMHIAMWAECCAAQTCSGAACN